MIHTLQKPFQVVLWETEERSSDGAAMRLDFDSLEEARADFDAQRLAGHFRTGVLLEWHKVSGQWELLDLFPR